MPRQIFWRNDAREGSDLFSGNAHVWPQLSGGPNVWPQLSGGPIERDLSNVSLDLQRCDTVLQDRVGMNGSSLALVLLNFPQSIPRAQNPNDETSGAGR
jgi:hypothetical protein